MAINEAESIKNKIKNSSHYCNCFYGDDYSRFRKEEDKLCRIRECYNGIIDYERYIIDAYYNIKNRENEINNQNDLFRRNLDSIRNSNENSLTIEKKKKDNEINVMRNQLDIYKKQCDCDIKLANEDILNLQKEIKELNLSKNEEIELLKKEKLFELKNDFKVN